MYLADVILTGVIRHDSVVREAKVHNILRFLNHGVETNQSQVPLHAEIDALGSMECLV